MSNKAEFEDFVKKSKEYNLIPIYREIRADLDTPLSIYLKLSQDSYSFLLESITGGENLARYSIIGTNQSINTKDKVFGDFTAKQNTNDKQNILKSYDLLLNKKYNVVLNEKTIERVKNFFK